ncbi:hypothetical protein BCR32DRAFT_288186 [Anaeromyces robustus]|uniref:Uncharacterized protein n=1 Tax=Anaeromyces robustus TaxID=1754192 RepID=A0A1Y1V7E1_9FUNG|nr:hypothetical protein BCR32DRAFT_288186 [Anaeromyces robustus]|eukprot:ORX49205.1 hypothetical protein BCR32DRAFT_288186 [Anaeromyces robustus]
MPKIAANASKYLNIFYQYQILKTLNCCKLKENKNYNIYIFNVKMVNDYCIKEFTNIFEKPVNLENLEVDLPYNCFSGPIPESILNSLKKLKSFRPKRVENIDKRHNNNNNNNKLSSNKEISNNCKTDDNKNIEKKQFLLNYSQKNIIQVFSSSNDNTSQNLINNNMSNHLITPLNNNNYLKPPVSVINNSNINDINNTTYSISNNLKTSSSSNYNLKPSAPVFNDTDIILNATAPPETLYYSNYDLAKNYHRKKSLTKVILEFCIFNNNFILKLLSINKNKTPMSKNAFYELIRNEKGKFEIKEWYYKLLNKQKYMQIEYIYSYEDRNNNVNNIQNYYKEFVLFIHDLQTWTINRLVNSFSKHISNINNIIHDISKHFIPKVESYFIIRINYEDPNTHLKLNKLITEKLSVSKIKWGSINTYIVAHHSLTYVLIDWNSEKRDVPLAQLKTTNDFISPSPSKTFKWSREVSKEFNSNNLFIDKMLSKFVQTSNKVEDSIKACIPSNLHGSLFHCPHCPHCPHYIKKLFHEKHIIYTKIKKFPINHDTSNISEFLNLCKPSYSTSPPLDIIKDNNDSLLFFKEDTLRRFAEHYELLVSNVTSHSLNKEFLENKLGFPPPDSFEWNINILITISEIYETVSSLKNNKTPDPDGIPSEFFKAFFCEYFSNNNQPNN